MSSEAEPRVDSGLSWKRKSCIARTSYSMVFRPLTLRFSSLPRTEAWDLVSRGSSCKCSARFSCCSCGKLGASSSGANLIEPKQWGKRVWWDVQRCVPINSGRRRRPKEFWGWPKKSGLCKSASKEVCVCYALPGHSSRKRESSGGKEKRNLGEKGFHPQRSNVGSITSQKIEIVKPWSRLAHSCRSLSRFFIAWGS